MKKIIIILIIIFLFIAVLTVFFYKSNPNKVCFKGTCFKVKLALTPIEQEKGLMFRSNLDLDEGMFFIFQEEGIYSFWMKNTLIPLDIIWMNEKGEIIFISGNTVPCRDNFCPAIGPDKKAKYVLEINGGLGQKLGMKIGDSLKFELR